MRLLACFMPPRTEMPDAPDDLARLREAHYGLEDLPETLSFPQHRSREADAPVAIDQASIDDIAFAIIAAEQESAAVYRRCSALQRLYKLAREAGGAGADLAVKSALERKAG